ncbi:transposase [Meiothermus sp.]|uniref:transposase n=1 Tax=Meiothermus sp. TaxID=1955249 RepID=UPI0039A331FE
MKLCGVKLEETRKGFVLLPRRWVVERSFAWMARFRWMVRDYERLAETLRGFHWLAFSILPLPKVLGGLGLASYQARGPIAALPVPRLA